MKLKPLHDWAVLVPCIAEDRTAGGLFIPDTAKEKPKEGVVEAVGPGTYEEDKKRKKEERKERRFIPAVVKPGDRVLYESWAGKVYKIGEDERVLVRERSILGLIERPLQIPAATTATSETAVVEYQESLPAKKSEQDLLLQTPAPEKTKPTEKITEKKTMKKATAKKTIKKTVKKSSSSKTAKKAVKNAVKKSSSETAKKAAKKAAKKGVAKAAKKSAKKTAKKSPASTKAVKKAAKKSASKTVKQVKATSAKKTGKKK